MASTTVAEPTSSDEAKDAAEEPGPSTDPESSSKPSENSPKEDKEPTKASAEEDINNQNFGGYLLKIISDIIYDISDDEEKKDETSGILDKVSSSRDKSESLNDGKSGCDDKSNGVAKDGATLKRKQATTGVFKLNENDPDSGHVAPKKRFLAGFHPEGDDKRLNNSGSGKENTASSSGNMIYHMRNCIDGIVDSRYIRECIRCDDHDHKGEPILEQMSNELALKSNSQNPLVSPSDLIPKEPGAPLTEMAAMACRVPQRARYMSKKPIEVIDLEAESNDEQVLRSRSTNGDHVMQRTGHNEMMVQTGATANVSETRKPPGVGHHMRMGPRVRQQVPVDVVPNQQHFHPTRPPMIGGRPMASHTMVASSYPGHMHPGSVAAHRSHLIESQTLATQPMQHSPLLSEPNNHGHLHPAGPSQMHSVTHPLPVTQSRWSQHDPRPGYSNKEHHVSHAGRPPGLTSSHSHIQGASISSPASYHSSQASLSANLLQQGTAPSLPIMIAEMARQQRHTVMPNPAVRLPTEHFQRQPTTYTRSDTKVAMGPQEAALNGPRYGSGPPSHVSPQAPPQLSAGDAAAPGYVRCSQQSETRMVSTPDACESVSCCPSDCPHSEHTGDDHPAGCPSCSEMECSEKCTREAPLNLSTKPGDGETPLDLSIQKPEEIPHIHIKKEPIDYDGPPLWPGKHFNSSGAAFPEDTHRGRREVSATSSVTATSGFEFPYEAAKYPAVSQPSMLPRLPPQMPPSLPPSMPQAMPRPMPQPVVQPMPPPMISPGGLSTHPHRQPQMPIHIPTQNPLLKPNFPPSPAVAWTAADPRMRGAAMMTSQWMQAGMPPQPFAQVPLMQQSSPTKSKGAMTLIGNHAPCDILYLKCNLCHQTYGNLHNFRKHFLKSHGFDPSPSDVLVRTISATKEAESSEHRVQHAQYASHPITDATAAQTLTHKLPAIVTCEGEYFPGSTTTTLGSNTDTSWSGQNMQCFHCGLQFPTRDWGVFRRHMRIHEVPGLYCPFCQQPARDEEALAQHKSVCATISRNCPQCRAVFAHGAALATHMKEAHGLCPPSRQLVCPYCAQYFQNPKQLTLHVREHEKSIGLLTNTSDDSHTPVSRASPDSTNDLDNHKRNESMRAEKIKPRGSLSLLDIVKQKIEEASNKLLDKCEELPMKPPSGASSKAVMPPSVVATKLPLKSNDKSSPEEKPQSQPVSSDKDSGKDVPKSSSSGNTCSVEDTLKAFKQHSTSFFKIDQIKDTHSVEQALNWIVEKALMETLISDKNDDTVVPVFSVLSKLQESEKKGNMAKREDVIIIDPIDETEEDQQNRNTPETTVTADSNNSEAEDRIKEDSGKQEAKNKHESSVDDSNGEDTSHGDMSGSNLQTIPSLDTNIECKDDNITASGTLVPGSDISEAPAGENDKGPAADEANDKEEAVVSDIVADPTMPRLEAQSPRPEVLPVAASGPPKLTLEINCDVGKPDRDSQVTPGHVASERSGSTSAPSTPRSGTPGCSTPTTPGAGRGSLTPSPRLFGKKRWVAAHQEETSTKKRRDSIDD